MMQAKRHVLYLLERLSNCDFHVILEGMFMRTNIRWEGLGGAAPSKPPLLSKRSRRAPYLVLLALLLLTMAPPQRPALYAADQAPAGAGLSQADPCAQVTAVPA